MSALDADLERCRAMLPRVSRTFAEPIEQLPAGMREASMLGYLVCRIADTVEDHPSFSPPQKEELLRLFADVMAGEEDARLFDAAFAELEPGGGADAELSRELSVVVRALAALHPGAARACRRWARELSMGMNIYVQRPPGRDGLTLPLDEADLERYCYFVAGTVGHFTADLLRTIVPSAYHPSADGLCAWYGIALQLVNILKDVGDDLTRDVGYLPRSVLTASGASLKALGQAGERQKLRRALAPLFARARTLFREKAVPYCLSIPEEHHDLRVAFLLPVWLALPTLNHLERSPDYLAPGATVRLSRLRVMALVKECRARARRNDLVLEWAEAETRAAQAAREAS